MMQQHLSRRLLANPPSGIRRIGQQAREIPGCIALTIGEPDFDAPLPVREGIAGAILAGETHYPPNAGYPELLDEIAAHLNGRFGTDYAENEVVATVGSTEALACALLAVGSMVAPALETAELLVKKGISAAVVNCSTVKPIELW